MILNLNRYLSNLVEFESPIRVRRALRNIPRQGRDDGIQRALFNVQELVYFNIRQTARKQSKLAEEFKIKYLRKCLKLLKLWILLFQGKVN